MPRRFLAGPIGHRVACLDNLDPVAGRAVSMTRDDEAFERAGRPVLEGAGHRRRGFAGADDHSPARHRSLQVCRDYPLWISCGERGLEQRQQQLTD